MQYKQKVIKKFQVYKVGKPKTKEFMILQTCET